jgi:hypothetical protein
MLNPDWGLVFIQYEDEQVAIISIQILSITRIRTNNEQSEKIKIEMKTRQQSKNNTKYIVT